ncbi:MAG: LGFP repeat-containing protein [Mycobacteriaceae bacterium]
MNSSFKRAAGLTAAFAATGLLVLGCSDDSKDKVKDSLGSATSVANSASAAVSSAVTAAEQKFSTPAGEITLSGELLTKYTALGGATGALGLPTGPAVDVAGGKMVPFANGTVFFSEATGAHVVQGEILRVYTENGGPAGAYGFPTTDETVFGNGWISEFKGGKIAWTDPGTAVYVEQLMPM